MPGKWDTSLKRLVGENPEHFLQWLLPEARFQGEAKSKPPNLNDREIEADTLYEIILYDLLCLFHIEFQTYYDAGMAKRMWEYNALATFSYNCPTCSFVIYLRKCEVPEPFFEWTFPTGEVVHHFRFRVLKLWEIPTEVLKRTGLVGILPLMVLAQDGKRPEVVEEIIDHLQVVGGQVGKELLSLTYILASLVFEQKAEQQWLKRRFGMLRDILRDTWAYKEIMQEGWQEGIEKGLQEGIEKGLQEGIEKGIEKGREEERQQELLRQRQLLMTIVQMHFPNSINFAQKQSNTIKDPEVLQSLIFKVLAARTEEQATQTLLEVNQNEK